VSELVPLNPLGHLMSLRTEMDRLLAGSLRLTDDGWGYRTLSAPPVDVYETDTDVVVAADLPGYSREDLSVSINEGSITLSGGSAQETTRQEGTYHRRERRTSSFSRTVPLPMKVDPAEARAVFHDGVLEISLPKTADARPRRLEIEGG